MLRTPLLPAAAFYNWGASASALPRAGNDTGNATPNDMGREEVEFAARATLSRSRLATLAHLPLVREAIAVASSDLFHECVAHEYAEPNARAGRDAITSGGVTDDAQLVGGSGPLETDGDQWLVPGGRVEAAVARYVTRMACRSTPFGLFAGCSMGLVGSENHLTLRGTKEYRRSARLDMGYIWRLTELLALRSDVRMRLQLRPNDTIYRVGDRVHYV